MNRRTLVLLGFLLQAIAVFAIFLPNMVLQSTGTVITLRTEPVDPRSMFRGDYVVLSYEAGDGLPLDWDYGKPVFAVLKQNGDVYEKVRFTDAKPELAPGEVCLRGVPQYMRAEFPDIAQYFVSEGEGRELENARNHHRLFVEVATGTGCRAVIKAIRLGPAVPPEEIPQPEFPEGVLPPPEPRPVPPGQ